MTAKRSENVTALTVDPDAVFVAMTIAPGVFARNRMFTLFRDPRVMQARARASMVRGIVRHLAILGADGRLTMDDRGDRVGGIELRYSMPRLAFDRTVTLSPIEAATLRWLACRSGVTQFPANETDRAMVLAKLRTLEPGATL